MGKGFVGKAVITITAAKISTCEKASKKITVTVNPSAPSISRLKKLSGTKLKVTWKKNGTGSGYQLQYAAKKSFSGKKTKTIKGASKTSCTITGLKKGTTCYVRLRTYKTVSGKTCYSGWSKIKQMKLS